MKKTVVKLMLPISLLSLVSCTNVSNQDMGTVAGAVAGGLLGSQFGGGGGKVLATGIGAVAGAVIGNAVGKSMDATDRMKMNTALEHNASGKPAYWTNDRTNTSYTVTPVSNVTINGNPYCREYQTTAVVAGKKSQVYGTACRQPDGSWKVQS